MRRRRNPDLILLTNPTRARRARRRGKRNPATARKAWGTFHLTDGNKAKGVRIPDVAGLPREVVSLGALEEVRFGGGRSARWRRSATSGPWLVTDAAMRRLWAVGRSPLVALRAHAGERSDAVAYYPERESGKHEASRGFLHHWGDGGPLPRARWREVWPRVVEVRGSGGRAYAFTGGRFTVTPEGIVN